MAGFFKKLRGMFGGQADAESEYELAEVYKDLRNQAIHFDPKRFNLDPSSPNRVWGMLMEMGRPGAVVTLMAMADGAVSLYFSNGGGAIGYGEHEGPRYAALEFLADARTYLGHAQRTSQFPVPAQGRIRFYFLTLDGPFTAEAAEDDLGDNRVPLSPLFHKAHEVIAQARFVDERREAMTQNMLHAAAKGDLEKLESLMEETAWIQVADKTGLTPLMAACYMGQRAAAALLLEAGAKIEAVDEMGYTALTLASNKGQVECARLLIEKGANVHHEDKDSSTPIMFAAQHAYNDMVKLLLAHGADPNFKGKHGLSAMGFAQQNGHTETERLLRSGGNAV